MGIDLVNFVYPDRISSQLLCTICQEVLQEPVQTSCDHLFCEEELSEWLANRQTCPFDNCIIKQDEISKPSRIVTNMLGELERYCKFKDTGCDWTGPAERLKNHLDQECLRQKALDNEEALAQKESEIAYLRSEVLQKDEKIKRMGQELEDYSRENESLQTKVLALQFDIEQVKLLVHSKATDPSSSKRKATGKQPGNTSSKKSKLNKGKGTSTVSLAGGKNRKLALSGDKHKGARGGSEAKQKKIGTKMKPIVKPKTAFLYWSSENKDKILNDNRGVSLIEIANLMQSRWSNLSDAEREPYVAKAKADAHRYDAELKVQ